MLITYVDRQRDLLIGVREDHRQPGEAVNTLVKVACDGREHEGDIIVSGNNFYSSPRLSPDGSRLAWLTWNHPNLPWDGTETLDWRTRCVWINRPRRARRGRQ